jgi:hypothetical protein
MKVKQTIKKITKTQKIPMDREVVKYLGEFFGRSIAHAVPREDEKFLTFSIQQDEKTKLQYQFNKDTISKIKTQLSIKDDDTQLSVGRLASKMWVTLIVLAYEQGQKDFEIKGQFTYRDILKLWGANEGSKLYSDIRNIFISLSSARFVQKIQEGDKTKTKFHTLINSGEINEKLNEEEATEFKFVLNNDALGLTADWIRWGRLSKSRQNEGYLSLPVSDLEENTKNVAYLNFRERLRLYKGGELSGWTVLTDWIKLDKDKLRRRGYCHDLLDKCLAQAKAENELAEYKAVLPQEKGWEDKWRVTVSK